MIKVRKQENKKNRRFFPFLFCSNKTPTCACCGPQLTTTTSSAIFFSFMRTASSTAISSNGFIECFTPSVTTPVLSGFTRT